MIPHFILPCETMGGATRSWMSTTASEGGPRGRVTTHSRDSDYQVIHA
jgi:hypothetical protein